MERPSTRSRGSQTENVEVQEVAVQGEQTMYQINHCIKCTAGKPINNSNSHVRSFPNVKEFMQSLPVFGQIEMLNK